MGSEVYRPREQYSVGRPGKGSTGGRHGPAFLRASRPAPVAPQRHTGRGQSWRGWTRRPQPIHLTTGTLSAQGITLGLLRASTSEQDSILHVVSCKHVPTRWSGWVMLANLRSTPDIYHWSARQRNKADPSVGVSRRTDCHILYRSALNAMR